VGPSIWFPRGGNELFGFRRYEAMILDFPDDRLATGPSMQCVPDFEQNPVPVLSPLMIPKPQLFDSMRRQEQLTLSIVFPLLRQAVVKTIEFNAQFCERTIEVHSVNPYRMLTSEFESRKSSGAQ